MKKSRGSKTPLTVKLSESKSVQVRIKVPKTLQARRLDDMNETELRHELETLPRRIVQAREARDRLWSHLRERWSTAYANDHEFVTAYARAEAAGAEVVALLERAAKASRIFYERYSGKLL